jgi:hypothetical protein
MLVIYVKYLSLAFFYVTVPMLVVHAVAWLVEALCYKPEVREFDFR